VKVSLNITAKENAHFMGSFTSEEIGPGYDPHTFGIEPALSMPNYVHGTLTAIGRRATLLLLSGRVCAGGGVMARYITAIVCTQQDILTLYGYRGTY
jgi:hypothetical protein